MRMLRESVSQRYLKSTGGLALALCLTPSSVTGMTTNEDNRTLPVAIQTDLSLVTDFWRSQFRNISEENTTSPNESGSPNSSGPRSSATDSTTAVTQELVPEVAGDLPIATESDALEVAPIDSETLAMSDWESAESRSGSLREKTLTKDGPSMVTAVVGVVGLIVVFGAYLKGKS
jgi:hypothetical protein